MGPREAAWLRLATGFGDQSAYFRGNLTEERSDLRLGCHELRPREKRKDRRANNSFKPTPFRCVACVRSLRSHTSPHRSRRGLTQALDRSQNYNVGRHALGVLGKAQPPDLFSLERRAALRRSPSFSRLFVGSRARLRPTRIWQWFAESHAGAHAPPCGLPRACVQSVFAGLRSR